MKMLNILSASVLMLFSSLNFSPFNAQTAETVFIGFPQVKVSEAGLSRVSKNLVRGDAANLRCIISKIGEKYYWASRENVQLVPIDGGGAFITFVATNGAGYVRIIKSHLKEAASMMSETEERFDYIEHIAVGLSTISYWGKQEK